MDLRWKITIIHTPGHTIESISYAVIDLASGKEAIMVLTET